DRFYIAHCYITSALFLLGGNPEVVFGQVNSTVTLPVTIDATGGIYEQWKGRLSLSGLSLVIKTVQPSDFQTFTCVLKQMNAVISKTTIRLSRVTVNVKPGALLVKGGTLSLTCDAERTANFKIHWLNPQGDRVATGGAFTKTEVTKQDAGVWTCVLTHDGRESRATVSVTVLDLSPAPPYPLFASTSSLDLTVPCSIPDHLSWENFKAKGLQRGKWSFVPSQASNLISGNPEELGSFSFGDSPTWKAVRDRYYVPDSKNSLSLTMKRPKETDRGEYVCTLEFGGGVTLKSSVHVEVLQSAQTVAGQPFNLSCSLGHDLGPDLRVKWIPPSRSALGPLSSGQHLSVSKAGYGEYEKWKCELWRNGTRLTSDEIRLKIGDVWLLVTICGAIVIFILFLILVLILRRRNRQVLVML
uniref:Ig-like domain-containing protein n=1 Tax=Myripristis murdjan TaxID=586833 RepID=A0A667YQR3_9TELE